MTILRLSPSGKEILGVNPGDTLVWNGAEWIPGPGGGGGETLAQTLVLGNVTGASDIEISENQKITNRGDGNVLLVEAGSADAPNPTASPLYLKTARRGTTNTGPIDIISGDVVNGGANSGEVRFLSGDGDPSGPATVGSGDSSTESGPVTVESGQATTTGDSGPVNLRSGTAGGNSGDARVASGAATGDSGNVTVEVGVAGGTRGALRLGGRSVTIEVDGILYQMPMVDGNPGDVLSTNGAGVLSWVAP